MKKYRLLPLVIAVSISLCGCSPTSEDSSSTSSATSSPTSEPTSEPTSSPTSTSEPVKFVTKTVGVKYVSKAPTQTEIRFYDDNDIPYIGVNSYYKLVLQDTSSFVISKEEERIEFTNRLDVKGIFDLKNQTFVTDDFDCFHTTSSSVTKESPVSVYDGLPFTKVINIESDKAPNAFSVDFKNYNIKMYGDENDVYLPFTTVNDFFEDTNLICGMFDGENIFFYYQVQNESASDFKDDFKFTTQEFSKECAELNYYELCLDYDKFVGKSGRSSLEKYYDLSNGLDVALDSRPLGRLIKEKIMSTNFVDYLTGISIVKTLVSDGGHSRYEVVPPSVVSGIFTLDAVSKSTKEVKAIREAGYEELDNYDPLYSHHGEAVKARNESFGIDPSVFTLRGDQTYNTKNDIAYITIDDFMGEIYNQTEWAKYYNNETDELPYGPENGGSVVSLVKGLEKARNDENIKKVVIDLTRNTGGSTDELFFFLRVLTGKSQSFLRNNRTNQNLKVNYKFDLNFDRVFDEKDDEIDFLGDLKFAVLTSRNGFSCGGISPIYLHDEGFYTIGDNCGGGSCSIIGNHDMYGFYRQFSSFDQMYSKNGISIDEARFTSCDTKLEIPETEDGLDFSNFFDMEHISQLIDERYAS